MLRWEIPHAHRAAVTCCTVRSDVFAAFLVTGSEDGSVRVWELRSRWFNQSGDMSSTEQGMDVENVFYENFCLALVRL